MIQNNTGFTSSTYKKIRTTTFSKFETIHSLRHRALERKITPKDKLKAGVGSIAGLALPMAYMMKKQKIKNPLKLEYLTKDMVTLSGASFVGGEGIGSIGENKKTKINKIKEGIFQFFNASIPVILTAGGLKLCEKSKKLNNTPSKLLATLIGISGGVVMAYKLSNLVCNPQNKEPERKFNLKDSIVNIDDLFGALALAKIPVVKNIKVERALPFVYSLCGYKAGESN